MIRQQIVYLALLRNAIYVLEQASNVFLLHCCRRNLIDILQEMNEEKESRILSRSFLQ